MKHYTLEEILSEMVAERAAALMGGLCVECRRPALEHCSTDAGRKEYNISGLCEECFDAAFAEREEDTGDDDEPAF